MNSNFVTSNSNIVVVRPGGSSSSGRAKSKAKGAGAESGKAGKASRPKQGKQAEVGLGSGGDYIPGKIRLKSASLSSEKTEGLNVNANTRINTTVALSAEVTEISSKKAPITMDPSKPKKKPRRKSDVTLSSKSIFREGSNSSISTESRLLATEISQSQSQSTGLVPKLSAEQVSLPPNTNPLSSTTQSPLGVRSNSTEFQAMEVEMTSTSLGDSLSYFCHDSVLPAELFSAHSESLSSLAASQYSTGKINEHCYLKKDLSTYTDVV
jgi:hypothetical protein